MEGTVNDEFSMEVLLHVVSGFSSRTASSLSFGGYDDIEEEDTRRAEINKSSSTVFGANSDLTGFTTKRTLRQRSTFSQTVRFHTLELTTTRKNVKEISPLAKLFISSSSLIACGGKVGDKVRFKSMWWNLTPVLLMPLVRIVTRGGNMFWKDLH